METKIRQLEDFRLRNAKAGAAVCKPLTRLEMRAETNVGGVDTHLPCPQRPKLPRLEDDLDHLLRCDRDAILHGWLVGPGLCRQKKLAVISGVDRLGDFCPRDNPRLIDKDAKRASKLPAAGLIGRYPHRKVLLHRHGRRDLRRDTGACEGRDWLDGV